MVTLVAGHLKVEKLDVNRVCLTVFCLFAYEDGKFLNLHGHTVFEDMSKVEIIVERWKHFWQLPIPPNLSEAILYFLKHYQTKQDISFDCYAFANIVCGRPQHRVNEMLRFWNIRNKRFWSRVGDVVFLVDKETRQFYHAAIYIGLGLYISVYGAGGDIEISTLKDMRADYKSKHVVVATPRKLKAT